MFKDGVGMMSVTRFDTHMKVYILSSFWLNILNGKHPMEVHTRLLDGSSLLSLHSEKFMYSPKEYVAR